MAALLNVAKQHAEEYWRHRAPLPTSARTDSARHDLQTATILAYIASDASDLPILTERLQDFIPGEFHISREHGLTNEDIGMARQWVRDNEQQIPSVAAWLFKHARTNNKTQNIRTILVNNLLHGKLQPTPIQITSRTVRQYQQPDVEKLLCCGAYAFFLITRGRGDGFDHIQQLADKADQGDCNKRELHEVYHQLVMAWRKLGGQGPPKEKLSPQDFNTQLEILSKWRGYDTQHQAPQQLIVHALSGLLETIIVELKRSDVRFMALPISKLPQATASDLLLAAATTHTSQALTESLGGWWRAVTQS